MFYRSSFKIEFVELDEVVPIEYKRINDDGLFIMPCMIEHDSLDILIACVGDLRSYGRFCFLSSRFPQNCRKNSPFHRGNFPGFTLLIFGASGHESCDNFDLRTGSDDHDGPNGQSSLLPSDRP